MASALFPQSYNSNDEVLDTANQNSDGVTGTYESITTGVVADKTAVVLARMHSTGNLTAAGAVRLWVYDGATAVGVWERAYADAYTINYAAAAGLVYWMADFKERPVQLPTTSHVFRGSTYNGDDWRILGESKKYA